MSAVSSRKPSGSQNPSRSHSPGSPGGVQARLINAGGAYAVGNLGGLKSLNSGWQVWNNPSMRNTPGSSIACAAELSPSRSDAQRGTGLVENWTTISRPTTSRSWDEVHDQGQLDSTAKARQGQIGQTGVVAIPRIEQTLGLKNGLVPANSPTRAYGSGFPNSPVAGNFENLPPSRRSPNVDDLNSAMRGMAVEDDPQDFQRQAALNLQSRTHLPPYIPQQSRVSYTSFPPPEYNPQYQPSQPSRESYPENPFNYDPYRTPIEHTSYPSSLIAATPAPMYHALPPVPTNHIVDHRRTNFLYDYSLASRPPAPQYYYPTQGVLYPTQATTQMTSINVPTGENKIDVPYPLTNAVNPMIQAQNVNFGSADPGASHMAAFGTTHMPQFMPMTTPLYSNGMLPYHPSIRIGVVPRSNLLEEFRTRKSRKWELMDIIGHVVEFSSDQYGSRFIQTKLETAGLERIQSIYDEIVPTYALRLMQDVFGNYVIQKLMDFGTQEQREGLARIVESDIVNLSLNVYGCRVVQKVIELCTAEQQTLLVRKVESHVLTVVKDTNGNHVIQKFVMTVPPERLTFLRAFRDAARQLAIHPFGCRVLQRCLEYLPNDYCRGMVDELHGIADALMQDQFGNYVVQYVLQHGQPHDCVVIASKMKGGVLKLSRHKFASNVVEKVLVHADPETRRKLVDEILDIDHGIDPIHTMMMDPYGNYVIQTALNQVEGEQRDEMYNRVRSQLLAIKRDPKVKIEPKHISAIERLLSGNKL